MAVTAVVANFLDVLDRRELVALPIGHAMYGPDRRGDDRECELRHAGDDHQLEFQMKSSIWFVSSAASTGCATWDGLTGAQKGTAIGAGVGGVAGAVITAGGVLGTVGGAAVGGVVGQEIGKRQVARRTMNRRLRHAVAGILLGLVTAPSLARLPALTDDGAAARAIERPTGEGRLEHRRQLIECAQAERVDRYRRERSAVLLADVTRTRTPCSARTRVAGPATFVAA